MFEHETAVTSLPRQLPPESQFAVEVTVLPVKLLLQLVSRPLAEADDGPHGAAEGAAAAQAAEQQPAHVDGESLAQRHVHPGHRGLELLGSHAGVEGCWELGVESVGKTKYGDVARAADDDGVRHEVDVGTLEDARHLVLLVLVDRVEVCHGLSSAGLRGLYFSSQLSLCFYAH